jgi:UDP:flavonoid glycosyltransferase YjiC (YdhE family)
MIVRVLMMITPGIGHAFPMVPLSWALQLEGHEVLVASCGPALTIGEAGVRTVDVAPGLSLPKIMGALAAAHPEMVMKLNNEAADDYQESLAVAVATAMSLQTEMVETLIRTAEDWRPDIVLYSPVLTPGLVAAAKLGVPAVQHGFGFLRIGGFAKALRELNADIFDRHGVDLPPERAAVDIAPPSMVTVEPDSWSMRYVPYNGGGALPPAAYELLTGKPTARRIAVTLGSGPPPNGAVTTVERILAMVPEMDAEFVLVVPNVDLDQFGPLPPNVRSLGWTPLPALLARCSALVHHGGPGTALAAIASGIPQLIPGFGGLDRHLNADAVTRRGVGLAMPPEDLDRDALETLLTDPGLRSAAAEVRDELGMLPRPADIVARLVEFAGR